MIAYFLPEGGVRWTNSKQLLQLDLTFPFCRPAVLSNLPACQNAYFSSNSALPLQDTNCCRWRVISMKYKQKLDPPWWVITASEACVGVSVATKLKALFVQRVHSTPTYDNPFYSAYCSFLLWLAKWSIDPPSTPRMRELYLSHSKRMRHAGCCTGCPSFTGKPSNINLWNVGLQLIIIYFFD